MESPNQIGRERKPGERLAVTIFPSSGDAARAVAFEIASIIRDRNAAGKHAVLGLATGSTPQGVYDELVRLHREDGLSFKRVLTFNLDEYWPMSPDAFQSYVRFMREHLFDHVDIPAENVRLPDGTCAAADVDRACAAYEQAIRDAGGIDLQILGIGRTGHIGFNEPGSSKTSRTRLMTLDGVTRRDAASDFFGERNVPRKAMTMGVGTILDAKRVILMAFGEHKAPIIRRAVEEGVTASVAASFLQDHADARLVLDDAASAELTRIKTPWKLGPIEAQGKSWTEAMKKRAVIWLANTLGKSILKLTDEDYVDNDLRDLLHGSNSNQSAAYDVNITVFRSLQATITGWPGGKPGRPKFIAGKGVEPGHPDDIFPKRVIVFSPHPDDDVISMGGTQIRLCDQGHEVHVAYQTSGNIAVWDDAAERHSDFMVEFCRAFDFGEKTGDASRIAGDIRRFIHAKSAGAVDSADLRTVKGLIRRTEARAAAKYSGVKYENIHFLDLPFYETGRVKKSPLGAEDIRITAELLDRIKPHLVYIAGDLSDPHGTHRVCLAAVTTALHQLASREWMKACDVWLYRGAWQEWEPAQVEMAVPLSPHEVERKRMAIFKHESQKDKAVFPGPNDPREFWQRAEDRNRATAQAYDRLGLPEYQAIEGFVLWKPGPADGSIDPATLAKHGGAS